jgi:MEMO1 family protein
MLQDTSSHHQAASDAAVCGVQGKPSDFTQYLQQFGNTICGRHPIGVLLQVVHPSKAFACPLFMLWLLWMSDEHKCWVQALQHTGTQHKIAFTKYDQSSQCTSISDSSVSYAAAVVTAS